MVKRLRGFLVGLLFLFCSRGACGFSSSIAQTSHHRGLSTFVRHPHDIFLRASFLDNIGSALKKRTSKIDELTSTLGAAGQSGLIAYGLLNLLYYTVATAIFWQVSAHKFVGERLLQRAAKVSSMVWLGSQTTKIFRLTGAVVMAPLADKLLTSMQDKFKISSRDKTFWILTSLILGTCLGFYGLLLVGTSLFTGARF